MDANTNGHTKQECRELLRDERLNTPQRLVLYFLAEAANGDGLVWWSQSRIAEYLGLSRDRVYRIIGQLVILGKLTVVERRNAVHGSPPLSNKYRVNYPRKRKVRLVLRKSGAPGVRTDRPRKVLRIQRAPVARTDRPKKTLRIRRAVGAYTDRAPGAHTDRAVGVDNGLSSTREVHNRSTERKKTRQKKKLRLRRVGQPAQRRPNKSARIPQSHTSQSNRSDKSKGKPKRIYKPTAYGVRTRTRVPTPSYAHIHIPELREVLVNLSRLSARDATEST